jgi:hypothetical protein
MEMHQSSSSLRVRFFSMRRPLGSSSCFLPGTAAAEDVQPAWWRPSSCPSGDSNMISGGSAATAGSGAGSRSCVGQRRVGRVGGARGRAFAPPPHIACL